jgi:hypothetical protein
MKGEVLRSALKNSKRRCRLRGVSCESCSNASTV